MLCDVALYTHQEIQKVGPDSVEVLGDMYSVQSSAMWKTLLVMTRFRVEDG